MLEHSQPRSLRACSRDDPQYGARRGVLRRRLVTVRPGRLGPRHPGITTWVKCAAATREAVCYGEMGPQAPVVPAKAGTHDHRRWLWVPALAALGRDDDGLVRAEHQPAAVRNDYRRNSIVSGLLFTMNGATATCRALQRP